jgi:glutamate--cysteine ligase
MGIGRRYGRRMQTISGIHYNWSMPGTSTPEYFALIRNFRRHAFLLIYLFGASPAVDASFVADRPHQLQQLAEGTFGRPHATSLRMGRLGYQSDAQSALAVSYNCLESYAASLHQAMVSEYDTEEWILSGYVLEPLASFGLIERRSKSDWPSILEKDSVRITLLWKKFISFEPFDR